MGGRQKTTIFMMPEKEKKEEEPKRPAKGKK